MILSFAVHFDRRTMNPSPDIFNIQTDNWNKSKYYCAILYLIKQTFLIINQNQFHFWIAQSFQHLFFHQNFHIHHQKNRNRNFFAGHFAQFPVAGHFVWREFTPSPDIWNFRQTCLAKPAHLTYSELYYRCFR